MASRFAFGVLGVALLAACASSNGDAAGVSSDALVGFTGTALRNANAPDDVLAPDGTIRRGSASFKTLRFWGNVGETIHLDTGATSVEVYRVYDNIDFDQTMTTDPSHPDFDTTQFITRGAGKLDFYVPHTGLHYVVIGTPAATTPTAYDISLRVDRAPSSKGIKTLSVAGDRACAVLASGKVKCWGAPIPFEYGVVVGDDRAEMGNALPAIPLPGSARDAVADSYGVTTLLEDGRVFAYAGGAPRQIPFSAPAVHLEGSSCAELKSGKHECFSGWSSAQFALEPLLPSWETRPIRHVSSWYGGVAITFDTNEVDCNYFTDSWSPGPDHQPTPLPLDHDEKILFVRATPFEEAVFTTKGVRTHHAGWSLVAFEWPFEPVGLTMKDFAHESWIWSADGRLSEAYSTDGVAVTWSPVPSVGGPVQSAGGDHWAWTCAIVGADRRAKCWGGNHGQFGVGDQVSRLPSRNEAFGESLPAVDLGE